MGQAGDEILHCFGDHDYCALSLGESRKRSAAILGAMLQAQTGKEEAMTVNEGKLFTYTCIIRVIFWLNDVFLI